MRTKPGTERFSAAPARALRLILFTLISLAVTPAPAGAVGGDEAMPTQSESARDRYERARAALDAGRPAEALPLLKQVVKAEPRNANAWNLIAYANRRMGRLDAAFEHYRKALALDPEHRGAHEYLGELYLQKGDLPSAEKMRVRLAELCVAGCEELQALDKALAAFRAGKFKPVGAW